MKAITLWQPWASLIACGAKKFETRSWPTSYRGPIAIHAAAKNPRAFFKDLPVKMIDAAREALGCIDFTELPRGCVLATANLIGCHRIYAIEDSIMPGIRPQTAPGVFQTIEITDENEVLFGDFSPFRFAWELENVKLLDEPIPKLGKPGLWEWYASEEEAV